MITGRSSLLFRPRFNGVLHVLEVFHHDAVDYFADECAQCGNFIFVIHPGIEPCAAVFFGEGPVAFEFVVIALYLLEIVSIFGVIPVVLLRPSDFEHELWNDSNPFAYDSRTFSFEDVDRLHVCHKFGERFNVFGYGVNVVSGGVNPNRSFYDGHAIEKDTKREQANIFLTKWVLLVQNASVFSRY